MFELYGIPKTPPPPLELPGKNNRIVELCSGQLVLIGDFNLFLLDAPGRALIDQVLDAVERYEANRRKAEPILMPGTANEEPMAQESTPEVMNENTIEDKPEDPIGAAPDA
jgi:hypothetical protein